MIYNADFQDIVSEKVNVYMMYVVKWCLKLLRWNREDMYFVKEPTVYQIFCDSLTKQQLQ